MAGADVRRWCDEHRLASYADAILDGGFDTMEDVRDMDEDDLLTCGQRIAVLRNHQRRRFRRVRQRLPSTLRQNLKLSLNLSRRHRRLRRIITSSSSRRLTPRRSSTEGGRSSPYFSGKRRRQYAQTFMTGAYEKVYRPVIPMSNPLLLQGGFLMMASAMDPSRRCCGNPVRLGMHGLAQTRQIMMNQCSKG